MLSKIQSPQSICILRLSAIGDVCHAVACVQAIQKRWPLASITWIIGKVELMLLDDLPGVEFICFDKGAGKQAYRDIKRRLAARQFDILLHMQVALRASRIARLVKAKEKWGFDRARAKEGQWLFTNQKIKPQIEPHVVHGFWGFALAIGVDENKRPKWQMPIKKDDDAWYQQRFKSVGSYMVIAPAASKAERNWLAERYAAIAKHAQKKGLTVIICGGPTLMEKQLAQEIISYCDFELVNLVGETSLKQLLVVLKNACLVLAPDTGPAHMASSVNTPVIGLYAHSNPKRTGPYQYLNYVVSCYQQVVKEQTGKDYHQLPWGKRAKGSDLMEKIQVADVVEMFERVCREHQISAEPRG